jgi:hypothetical protein
VQRLGWHSSVERVERTDQMQMIAVYSIPPTERGDTGGGLVGVQEEVEEGAGVRGVEGLDEAAQLGPALRWIEGSQLRTTQQLIDA